MNFRLIRLLTNAIIPFKDLIKLVCMRCQGCHSPVESVKHQEEIKGVKHQKEIKGDISIDQT